MGVVGEPFANIVFFDPSLHASGKARLPATVRVPRERAASLREPKPPCPDLIRWLLDRAGLRAERYRSAALARRLPACLRALHVASPEAARKAIEQRPDRLAVALDALLIGVTGFFRDAAVFANVKRLLPQPAPGRSGLDAWCAGCSDGLETYSLGMLLGERGLLHDSSLLGTDCRPGAIARARTGVYPDRALADLPGDLRTRYFVPVAGGARVASFVRARTSWAVADALSGSDPRTFDLILCRNLAIYLEPSAATDLWKRTAAALRPGGLLVVGKAERPQDLASLVHIAPCIFLKGGAI